ncbi:pyridoxal phosphate-dependent decarboxylase family protein [Dongia deserti]|uniref:pyridoxal phosphate-dependent decarboxylase family protein n=1 Tax=Dongia deserti TaxID=2268030 RepID=UPI0013C4FAC8|nr:aspartate aminotransferase family protein [Dongia deserti]
MDDHSRLAEPQAIRLRHAWDADHELMLRQAAEIAMDFRRSLNERFQRPERSFVEMRQSFAAPLPEQGMDGFAVIEELAALAEPGLATMTGPRFFGWVMGASHPVGVAADWLTSAWGQNCGNHAATPAAAACEEAAANWLLELLQLPGESSVGFATGATLANLICLAAARGELLRRVGWDVEANGLFGAPRIRVLIGEEAHATVFSGLQLLGLGHDRVIPVPTDPMGGMKLGDFEAAMKRGNEPAIVITQAGHINTGAFDPIGDIAEIARRGNAWVHVDGAFGLWARACPETAPLAAGMDKADSWATDGHKWLQLPYDCGFAIVRNSEAHRRAMAITASYLPAVAADERNPAHYVPELSRRARGFAAWAMIRAFGRQGIAQLVAHHCRIARRMARVLSEEAGICVLNDVLLNQVVVRFGDDDLLTKHVIARIQKDGICFAAGAEWKGQWIMRLSVTSWATSEEDADHSVAAIIGAWRQVQAEAA